MRVLATGLFALVTTTACTTEWLPVGIDYVRQHPGTDVRIHRDGSARVLKRVHVDGEALVFCEPQSRAPCQLRRLELGESLTTFDRPNTSFAQSGVAIAAGIIVGIGVLAGIVGLIVWAANFQRDVVSKSGSVSRAPGQRRQVGRVESRSCCTCSSPRTRR